MPVTEIRDTIEGTVTTDPAGLAYFTRRINLEEGYRYDMLLIDVYNDNLVMPMAGAGQPAASQIYISPYPMQQIDGIWGVGNNFFPGGGQAAGEPNVLYKEVSITNIDAIDQRQQNYVWTAHFPNDAVGARPTFRWFTPHVYVTVMLWNVPETSFDVKLSVYMQVNKKRSSKISASMGRYSEFLDSQIKLLTDTAVVISPNNVSGYTFPMWKYGGVRPELMISGTTALRYYNKAADNASQDMVSRGDLQTAFQSATNMVAYDAAFGDAANNLPEWITLMDVEGVTAGSIRPYAPPLKFSDNGNTLMF